MRVAMLGWEYPPFKAGGLATHCFGLTRSLADLGVCVDFFMPKTGSSVVSDRDGLCIVEVGECEVFPYDRPDVREIGGGFFDAVFFYNELLVGCVLDCALRCGGYDLVHCHDWLTMRAGMVLKGLLGVPLVVTVHSTEFDRCGWLFPNDWFVDLEREGMLAADCVIAVSHFTRRVLLERYGVPEGRVVVVHNAVYPVGEGCKREIVLFLGRLTVQKGAEFFLRAAQKVCLLEPDVRFVVAGTGDLLPRLISEAISLGIGDRVFFTGLLSDEEVRHIYGISSVYVMPSVSEPFGITALEAASAGTPVVVSRSAGFSEVFSSCLRVDFWDVDEMANKIVSLLRYDVLHRSLSVDGLREICLFTWDRVAGRTLDVYRSVLGV
jgi:glycosyltransferase involved in cell wall biosynthesis